MPNLEEMMILASQHQGAGNFGVAEQLYQQVLRAVPDRADAHCCLGVALAQQGKTQQALASLLQALRCQPDYPEAHNDLANVLQSVGKVEEAVVHYGDALRLRPDYREAHNNLGVALARLGKLEESAAHHHEAVRLSPNYAAGHYNLGSVLERQDKLDEAIACYRQALTLRPDLAEAWNNLGNALERQDKFDEAVGSYQQALRLRPDYAEVFNNLGKAYYKRARIEEAAAHFDRALQLKPDCVDAHCNRALLRLLLGDCERAWPDYEWRRAQPGIARPPFSQPLWDGADLRGRSILLYAEQGLGDTLQFIRYAPLVKERGGKVIVHCPAPLLCVLSSVAGIDRLAALGTALPAFDVHAPLLSLPGIFRTTLAAVPAKLPYLHVDPKLVDRWRLPRPPGIKLRVGIVWQGNPLYRGDRQRSIPLKWFGQLARVRGVQLVSLQKGPGTDQLLSLPGNFEILDLESRLGANDESFANVAAIIKNLDLVISCDTAIAHLAGALGGPVWVALPLIPDWRWLLRRSDSPWYPGMRLFRQSRYGQWDDVFEAMADQLGRLK